MAKRRFRIGIRRKINVQRVVSKIVASIIVLYVGGQLLSAVGTVINGSTSPFYQGLTIIGWTVTNGNVTNVSTGTGILTVVGIIAIASVIMEFVYFKL